MLELLDLRERGGRLEPSKLEIDPAITETVRQILQRVFVEGDDVLVELSKQFDGADLSRSGILVTEREFAHAERETPAELRAEIDALIDRLRGFCDRQIPREWWDEHDGIRFGEIVRPLASVGCYVPGGRAKYPSTVAMTVVPATVAGVEEIVVCTPPQRDGSIHAAVLYAAKRAGATDVAIRHTKLVLVRDLVHAAAAVNDVAAEHLLLLLGEPEDFLPSVRNAGAIFLGSWSAVPFGDYGLASNHVLPTAGTARFSSGLRAADYVTITSVMRMSPAATAHFSPGTSTLARAEGLVGHAKAMEARADEAGDR